MYIQCSAIVWRSPTYLVQLRESLKSAGDSGAATCTCTCTYVPADPRIFSVDSLLCSIANHHNLRKSMEDAMQATVVNE